MCKLLEIPTKKKQIDMTDRYEVSLMRESNAFVIFDCKKNKRLRKKLTFEQACQAVKESKEKGLRHLVYGYNDTLVKAGGTSRQVLLTLRNIAAFHILKDEKEVYRKI